ncbi:MAG: hypothetical protein AB7S38_41545 [Vulcanimicrobiota bacterium]
MKRGFSLVELMFALGLVLLTFGLFTLNLRPRQGSAERMAQVVAGEIKAARERALATGIPTAVVFPAQATGFSQSLAVVQGNFKPRVERVVNLGRDMRGSYLFYGFWDVPKPQQVGDDSTLFNGGSEFDLLAWQPPPDLDMLVFLPSGAMVTNGVVFDHARHIVCCDGLTLGSGSVGGQSFARLTEVARPFTVRVATTGQVEIIRGLVDGSVPMRDPYPPASACAPALAAATPANEIPTATAELFPNPNAATLPAGASGTVKLKGFVSLRLEAEDEDGDTLYSRWTSPDGGTFSQAELTEMQWDPVNQHWTSLHEWRPPNDAVPNQEFTLEYEVVDQRGGQASGVVGLTGKISVLPRGRIVIAADPNGEGNAEICALNADGTDLTNLTNFPGPDTDPSWSPDGSLITFSSLRGGRWNIYTMNPDGSQLQEVVNSGAHGLNQAFNPEFDPTGNYICFSAQVGSTFELFVVKVDGSDPTPLGQAPVGGVTGLRQLGVSGMTDPVSMVNYHVWDPSGQFILAEGGPTEYRLNGQGETVDYRSNLYVVEVATGTWTNITNYTGALVHSPNFLPGTDEIIFATDAGGGESIHRGRLDLTSSPPQLLNDSYTPACGARPSPDGEFVLAHGWGDLEVSAVDGSGRRTLLQGIGRGHPSWAISF